ncbi:hypothetical protein QUA07_02295 [Microcoleus sp. T3_A4]
MQFKLGWGFWGKLKFSVHDRRWLCTGFDLFYLFFTAMTLDRTIA